MVHRRITRALTAAMAVLMLSLAVTAASANRLSLSNQRIRLTWSALTFNPGEVRCQVTIEGSFHSLTIRKASALIGHVSRGIVKNETCTNGRVTILQEVLPWHIGYNHFEGMLPRITGVHLWLIDAAIRVEVNFFGIVCLIKTTSASPGRGIARLNPETGLVTSYRADESLGIPLTGGCASFGEASLMGEGRAFVLGTSSSIGVRLI